MIEKFEKMVERGEENLKYKMTSKELRKHNILTFAAAEMDFPTAPSIIKSVQKLVENGLFGFTQITEAYRDRIRYWMDVARDFEIENEWIVPTYGTIFSLATTIRFATVKGEGVIVQEPGYSRYEQAIIRLGRNVVVNKLNEETGYYQMDIDNLEKQMSQDSNRLLVLCNPHSPTGRVWKKSELEKVVELAKKYQVTIFSDEIFAEVVYDGNRTIPIIELAPENGICCTSLGKTFNFTGVNQANILIADSKLREKFIRQRNEDHYGSLEPFAYASIMGAYTDEGLQWKNEMVELINENRLKLTALFDKNGVDYLFPVEGSYVAWIKWNAIPFKGQKLIEYIEHTTLIALDCGCEYGSGYEKYTRMNLGTGKMQMEDAIKRLGQLYGKNS